MGVTKNLT
nr:cytochrome b6/f complex subunit IV [Jaltomata sinuosa]UNZ91568.1 cytochrome b6/f complex subunit IV [Jaltomata sinuosa]